MMTSSKLVCGQMFLEDVNHLPLCEPVGPRHSVTEDDQAIDFFFIYW